MYLSKLELNPRSREARRDLAVPYELHRTLAHAFPTCEGEDYRATHSVLFRIEMAATPSTRPVVLVQSATAPAWDQLPAAYVAREPQSKRVEPSLSVDQTFRFRLVANPTKKVKREGQRQGNRVALPDAGEADGPTPAQQWLHRKGELCGFEVVTVLSEGFYLNVARYPSGQVGHLTKQQLPLYAVQFDGFLRVTAPALLADAVRQGIGPAKAFGFGLLSLG